MLNLRYTLREEVRYPHRLGYRLGGRAPAFRQTRWPSDAAMVIVCRGYQNFQNGKKFYKDKTVKGFPLSHD